MTAVLLRHRLAYPVDSDPDKWAEWAVNASDKILGRFRALQMPNLLSEALNAACTTVLYRVPMNDFPFDLDREDIALHDVVAAGAHLLTLSTVADLLKMSPNFSQPDRALVTRLVNAAARRGLSPIQFITSLGVNPDRVTPWIVMGNLLHPDIQRLIKNVLQEELWRNL